MSGTVQMSGSGGSVRPLSQYTRLHPRNDHTWKADAGPVIEHSGFPLCRLLWRRHTEWYRVIFLMPCVTRTAPIFRRRIPKSMCKAKNHNEHGTLHVVFTPPALQDLHGFFQLLWRQLITCWGTRRDLFSATSKEGHLHKTL